MYAIETAKMSSKGQLVVPDTFRKRYGWGPGMSLLLIGTDDSLVIQSLQVPEESSVAKTVQSTRPAATEMRLRLRKARQALKTLAQAGISLPGEAELDKARLRSLTEKHA